MVNNFFNELISINNLVYITSSVLRSEKQKAGIINFTPACNYLHPPFFFLAI